MIWHSICVINLPFIYEMWLVREEKKRQTTHKIHYSNALSVSYWLFIYFSLLEHENLYMIECNRVNLLSFILGSITQSKFTGIEIHEKLLWINIGFNLNFDQVRGSQQGNMALSAWNLFIFIFFLYSFANDNRNVSSVRYIFSRRTHRSDIMYFKFIYLTISLDDWLKSLDSIAIVKREISFNVAKYLFWQKKNRRKKMLENFHFFNTYRQFWYVMCFWRRSVDNVVIRMCHWDCLNFSNLILVSRLVSLKLSIR